MLSLPENKTRPMLYLVYCNITSNIEEEIGLCGFLVMVKCRFNERIRTILISLVQSCRSSDVLMSNFFEKLSEI